MQKITVIGAWNTGTNLIHNILVNSDCVHINTGDKVNIQPIHVPLWKHNPKMTMVNDMIQDKDTIVIIMYRNIYNWLYSMLKHSYEVKINSLDGIVKIDQPNYGINFYFRNIVHLYNHYYINYKSFVENNTNVIFFDYNKIIDKDKAFDYINSKLETLDIKINSYENMLTQLNTPAKPHGNPVKNAKQAQELLDNRNIYIRNILDTKYPQLLDFIDTTLIEFYENDYHY